MDQIPFETDRKKETQNTYSFLFLSLNTLLKQVIITDTFLQPIYLF